VTVERKEYRLHVGDEVEVNFFYNERLNQRVTVRPDGRITLLRVGDVMAEGRTSAELDSIVTEAFSEILVDPEVAVIVQEFRTPDVYVLGRVRKPGVFPLDAPLTALDAIAMAGGVDDGAKLTSVVLIHRGEEGVPFAERVNLKKVVSSSDLSRDVRLAAYDVVYVPDTFIFGVQEFMRDFFQAARSPADAIVRWDDVFNLKSRRQRIGTN